MRRSHCRSVSGSQDDEALSHRGEMLSWEEGARVPSQEAAFFFHCKSSRHGDESERSLGLGTGLAPGRQMALIGSSLLLSCALRAAFTYSWTCLPHLLL